MGIHCPIIRQGDDLQKIVIDSILKTTELEDGDVIGITESVVARAQGNYVTVDEVAQETVRLFGENPELVLLEPIYSRNRFSMILKGIARAAKAIYLIMPPYDEVGNPRGVNPWTGVDIPTYYLQICKSENCECCFYFPSMMYATARKVQFLDCKLHNWTKGYKTLKDYFPDKCEWGLLGSNKANEETLKLFPNKVEGSKLVNSIQQTIREKLSISVSVMIYGDGAYKDPDSNIWEWADPVCSPAYTAELDDSPNEIKLKAFADDKYKLLSGKELETVIKSEISKKDSSLKGTMASQGTTPRRYVNLLSSLMDLTSGSGDKGTPVVLVKNYFKNYASC